jgi:hypothetical protein
VDAALEGLASVLRDARVYLARPGNDFAWSSWPDAAAALIEVDRLIAELAADRLPSRLAVSVLFAPTGPIQEVSLSSWWGDEFLALAARADAAAEAAYNSSWWRRLLNRRIGGRAEPHAAADPARSSAPVTPTPHGGPGS